MNEYVKVWLLEDFVLGLNVDSGTKGATKYWKVEKEYENGDLLITRDHGDSRALLFADDLAQGAMHREPDLSYATGLHFGLERGYHRKWYGKMFKQITPPLPGERNEER